MTLNAQPVVLEGEHVRLEPLGPEHAQGLFNRGQKAEDWAYMPRGSFVDLADCKQWIEQAQAATDHLPFAIVETDKGRAVGSSRFLAIRPEHKGLEIGWTWLGRDWQRTVINTEAKLLLLQHAFDTLGAIRVEFKTDSRNERSQNALARIGAVKEGVFRNHMIVQHGHIRDSVYFSITQDDWPVVKQGLLARLGRNG
jgi:RimJ/RimL family protein N-acetyltransferase